MRGAVPVSDYKFIILGLIFLKYISDAFQENYQTLTELPNLTFKEQEKISKLISSWNKQKIIQSNYNREK